MDELSLEHSQLRLPVLERLVGLAELGDAGRERIAHHLEGGGDLVHLQDGRMLHRGFEVAFGDLLGGLGQRTYRTHEASGEPAAHDER